MEVNQTSHASPDGVYSIDGGMTVLTNTRGEECEEDESLRVAAQALECRDGQGAAVLEGPAGHARRLDTGNDPENDKAHYRTLHKRGQLQLCWTGNQICECLRIQISSKRTVAQ